MIRHVFRRCLHQNHKIVLSKDEKCFLAYHPEEPHPYEMTRPMPKPEKVDTDSPLKVDSKNMITESPNLEQLQQLTYTSRHYWKRYPGKEKREAYQNWFNDNEYRKGLTS